MIFLDVYGKNDVLYSGILVDFYFRPELEKLETLVLQNARKRKLFVVNDSNNEIKAGPVSHIPGDVFVIPATEIVNINIFYLKLGTVEQNAAEEPT